MNDWEPLEEDEVSEKLGVEFDPDYMQARVCRGHLRMEHLHLEDNYLIEGNLDVDMLLAPAMDTGGNDGWDVRA